MTLPDTLILGARGKTGRRLAEIYKARNKPVYLATRTPNAPNERAFNWTDYDQAVAAFSGVKKAYVVAPTDRSDHAEIMLPVLEAALHQGVKRMVLLSASSLERGGPMMGQIHDWMVNNVPEWTVLRPSWFMQNFAEGRHLSSIQERGEILSATRQGKVGFIDAYDISNVAAAALTDAHAWNADVILTGPQLLSYDEIAVLMSSILNIRISHQSLSSEGLEIELKQQSIGEEYAQMLAAMDVAISRGSETLTDEVLRRTGNQANSFSACLRADQVFREIKR